MSLFYHLRFVWDDRSPIENWAIPAALFSSSSSLLVDGCRFLSRMSWYFVFPIHPPFNYMNFASTFMKKKKNSPTLLFSHLHTSLSLWCFWGDVQCILPSKHVVCYTKSYMMWSDRLCCASVFQACPIAAHKTYSRSRFFFMCVIQQQQTR